MPTCLHSDVTELWVFISFLCIMGLLYMWWSNKSVKIHDEVTPVIMVIHKQIGLLSPTLAIIIMISNNFLIIQLHSQLQF